ncbi:hypothetical protein TNCV_1341531 [Trichonephila clavipes]|uniref:Uncharacterized protein n=1 Tax=Trichonephila clavipes TaxID=2585209 RepID=A0A8X6RWF8_TRICX|nr:hypothetical protein TNCV_1341531 [Trichonephila clavipes]
MVESIHSPISLKGIFIDLMVFRINLTRSTAAHNSSRGTVTDFKGSQYPWSSILSASSNKIYRGMFKLLIVAKDFTNLFHCISKCIGKESFHSNFNLHNSYITSFAFITTGEMRPNGSKILAVAKRTDLFVIVEESETSAMEDTENAKVSFEVSTKVLRL